MRVIDDLRSEAMPLYLLTMFANYERARPASCARAVFGDLRLLSLR